MTANPYERDGKWYFHDEVGDDQGPYPTEEKARQEMRVYGRFLDQGPNGLAEAFREEIKRLEEECERLKSDIKWFKKEGELHELAMQQNKDRMKMLEKETAELRRENDWHKSFIPSLKGERDYWKRCWIESNAEIEKLRSDVEDFHKCREDLKIAKGEAQRQFRLNLVLREALEKDPSPRKKESCIPALGKNPTVQEIVTHYLKENGYDGLFDEDCGCVLDDLMLCGEAFTRCKARKAR